ncbi:hypothetical protein QAD02_002763 [Eretmocerus hayati]|uniref:Uncharacterized protein n=1 Tax=Eretmocerus hayati TaxID=131215 RepID=A0ACC2NK68_9HYME|nr:hypothetical protein QAD02_002763 [Eretmocerus hayati]
MKEQAIDKLLSRMFKQAPFKISQLSYERIGVVRNDQNQNNPRAMKIVLDCTDDVKWVLVNQKNFCTGSIKCSNDRTPQQLKFLANVIDECKKREGEGEDV